MQQLCDWRNRQRREEGGLSGEVEMVEAELKDILYGPSPNMAYLATVNASAQIFLQETSNMPETLNEIGGKGLSAIKEV